jgi:hypothetical protein
LLSAGSTISFGLRQSYAGSPETTDRNGFTFVLFQEDHCYGLVVHFQLLSTRGYRPDAVTFGYWPSVKAKPGTFTLLFKRAFRRT